MKSLKEVRHKEGEIELELKPLNEMYRVLETNVPNFSSGNKDDKDELDRRHILQSKWTQLVSMSDKR